jgi:hypothetical protein
MRYVTRGKPIGYLKAKTLASFKETRATSALLKILARGNQDVAAGKVKPAAEVVGRLRAKRTAD